MPKGARAWALAGLLACGTAEPAPMDLGGAPAVCNRGCDDGLFCNGIEVCAPTSSTADGDGCVDGREPCPSASLCDEVNDVCRECEDADGDGRGALACGGDDCDDTDPNRFPGNLEVCDTEDHDEDCDPATFGVRDADGDGVADAACCNVDATGARLCGRDCDDTSARIGAVLEVCDRVDNDCDGTVDEDVTRTFFEDADGDGFGDGTAPTIEACEPPAGFVEIGTDCDDGRSEVSPGNLERCDAEALLDEDCDGAVNEECACVEGESRPCSAPGACAAGVEACDPDRGAFSMACSIAPILEVSCDDVDEDCDGATDEGLTIRCYDDVDNDGFAAAAAVVRDRCPGVAREAVGGCPTGSTNLPPTGDDVDCDDGLSRLRPGATEVCVLGERVDEDCDGAIDEGVGVRCFTDEDGDGFAPASATAVDRCRDAGRPAFGECPFGFTDRAPGAAPDCDDAAFNVNPDATEICEGSVDEDCDGAVDPAPACVCVTGTSRACPQPGVCSTGRQVCLGDRWSPCDVRPLREETLCDGRDEDCDGMVDDGLLTTCWDDDDRDGFAPATARSIQSCFCPSGTTDRAPVMGATDCDDTRPNAYPGAPELCNRLDDDCSGTGATTEDRDDDGYAPIGITTCSGGFPPTDCDDDDDRVNPGIRSYASTPADCRPGDRRCVGCVGGLGYSCLPSGAICIVTPIACPSVSSSAYQWDLDCNGVIEPQPPRSFCDFLANAFRLSGPQTTRSASECGTVVPHRVCGPGGGTVANLPLSCR